MSKRSKRKRRGRPEPVSKSEATKDQATEELVAGLSRIIDPPMSPATLLAANQPNPPKVVKDAGPQD